MLFRLVSKPSITMYSRAVSLFSTRTEDIQRSVIQRFTLANSETNSVSSTSVATTTPTKTVGSCRSVLLNSVLLTEAANIACRDGIHAVTLDHVVETVGACSSATRCVYVDDSALVDALWDELANQLERRLGDHCEVNAAKAGLPACEFVTPRLLVECQSEDFRELTVHDAITDPLISLLNEADGVNSRAFAQLLESAARVLAAKR